MITFNKFMEKRINNLYKIFNNIKIIPQAVDINYKKEKIKYKDYFIWIGKLRKIKNNINGFLFENILELNTFLNNFSNINLKSIDYIKKNHLIINEKNMYICLIN